jgi:hypothetical protein
MQEVSVEAVCFIIVKARQFDVKVAPSDPDPASNPADDREVEALETSPDDAVEEELRGAIEELSDDALAELLALFWTGRGDYTAEEWKDALAEAGRTGRDEAVAGMIEAPLLGDHLENGLSIFGHSCEDFEIGRL